MDVLTTFTTLSLVISCILTLLCIQQVLITPIQSKNARQLLTIRIVNFLFASTETVYIILCLCEYQNATKSISKTRFIFEMIRYFFLSICLLIFTLDRFEYLYKIHINERIPIWIRTIFITLCCIFNITLIITFSISLYSTSSFYWKIQLIHLKFDVVISCIIAIITICHIYYKFNQKIQSYLNTILSQHNQLKQIQDINNKLFDSNYMFQLTQGLGINDEINNNNKHLTKEDILANNLNLAAKIREANYKLFSYILLLLICIIIEIIYIPISISRVTDPNDMDILSPTYQLSSNLEYIFQRILFDIILIIFIYWMYDKHSLFKILFKFHDKNNNKLCIISCLNCSLFIILMREIYLLIIYFMNKICPCCISQNCLNIQQNIYDIKKYQYYFGHLPKTKQNQFISVNTNDNDNNNNNNNNINNNNINNDSLPNQTKSKHTRNRSQSHGIFESPPIINDISKERRPSQASICGVVQINDNDNNNDNNKNKNSHHRKQSTLLQYDDYDEMINNKNKKERVNGISLSDESDDSSSYDLQVPQQIIDQDADDDDLDFDDNKSEQYDNFAEIMIKRERDYLYGGNDENGGNKGNGNKIINDKNRRESLELLSKETNSRGSIGNLGKKRRNSLILNAVDNIKQGIKNIKEKQKEKQQQKKECNKEAQFMESTKNKLMQQQHHDHNDNNNDDVDVDHDIDDDDDEKEYYNTKMNDNNNNNNKYYHKRSSKDRLSAVRNSLKSIIPHSFSKDKRRNKKKNDYDAISQREHSLHSMDNKNNDYEPFEYATDTMIIHKHNNSDPLMVRHELTTDTDDDNISIATYGTTKDCLDDDLESELNAMNNPSVSPNRSYNSWNGNENTSNYIDHNNNDDGDIDEDINDEREASVSLSLESISNSLEEEEERSPPPPIIIKHNGRNINHGGRMRKNSIPLAQIQEVDGTTTDDLDGNNNHDTSSSSDDNLDVTVTIDDFSCDDMMTASML